MLFSKKKKKRQLAANRNSNQVIIVQDFTQIQVQSTFYQDLIICIYRFDPNEQDMLSRKYFHFVALSSDTKNDCRFVFATWMQLTKNEKLNETPLWLVFSDGGPKHFKITSVVNFFGFLSLCYGIDIKYNFFESNHGHSVCDAVASQAKKSLNSFQRDENKPINNPEEIVHVLNSVDKHFPQIAESSHLDEKFETFHGIRSCYKFTFNETEALGYLLSEDENPNISFPLTSESFTSLIKE